LLFTNSWTNDLLSSGYILRAISTSSCGGC
jgi:hypothetical protein